MCKRSPGLDHKATSLNAFECMRDFFMAIELVNIAICSLSQIAIEKLQAWNHLIHFK